MAKIVFMGTPEFAVPSLEMLIATQEVVGVVTQPDRPAGRGRQLQAPPVKIIAQANGLPVYQPKSLRSRESAMLLREWAPELIVVAAFGQILRPHVLELPLNGCLNIHASLLPRWRGAAPIHHAILAGDKETGISLMRMDEGLDTGPVYIQQSVLIKPDETGATLHDRLAQIGAEMLGEHLGDILIDRLLPTAQNEDLATYAPMMKKEDGAIDWAQSSQKIDLHIRAMTPWPSAYTSWNKKPLKVLSAEPIYDTPLPAGQEGEVAILSGEVVVLTGDSGILLKEVQLAGKRPSMIGDFLHGRRDFVGSVLPS